MRNRASKQNFHYSKKKKKKKPNAYTYNIQARSSYSRQTHSLLSYCIERRAEMPRESRLSTAITSRVSLNSRASTRKRRGHRKDTRLLLLLFFFLYSLLPAATIYICAVFLCRAREYARGSSRWIAREVFFFFFFFVLTLRWSWSWFVGNCFSRFSFVADSMLIGF